jgi:hypothetical protein
MIFNEEERTICHINPNILSVLTWNRFRLLLWPLDLIYSFKIGPGPQNFWKINLPFQLTILCCYQKHFHMIEFNNTIFGSFRIVIRARKMCVHTHTKSIKYMFHFSSYKLLLMHKIHSRFYLSWGTRWHSWLKCYAVSQKVVGSNPDKVIGFFLFFPPILPNPYSI